MAQPFIYHKIESKPADPSVKLRDFIGGHPLGFVCFVPNRMVFPNERVIEFTYENIGTFFCLCVYILSCRAQCHPVAVYPVARP